MNLAKEIKPESKDLYLFTLPNDIRVVFARNKNTMMVHCGLMVGTGSRDETHEINGISHFIEHTVFKGTQKRKSFQILDRLESVGGEINAYTSRERTCYYASGLKKYFERTVELLSDIVFNPVFPEDGITKEKSVITEEIEMYLDSPDESIYDEFQQKFFPGNSIGYSVLGSKKSVSEITREKIAKYRAQGYCTDNIVLSITGNLAPEKVYSISEKYLCGFPASKSTNIRATPKPVKKFEITEKKHFQQLHCIIGSGGYSLHDKRKYPLFILNNILGGDWMSSRLNLEIREKHAYAYHIGTNYAMYSDCGLFSVQLGTDIKYLEKCLKIIHSEFSKLMNKELTPFSLNRAKRQIFSAYSSVGENNAAMMQVRARNILDFGRVILWDEMRDEFEKVTIHDVIETANLVFNNDNISTLIYESTK